MLSAETLAKLNDAVRACAVSASKAADAFRGFAGLARAMKEKVESDPRLLRQWGRRWPKGERRRIGRRVKRLERVREAVK